MKLKDVKVGEDYYTDDDFEPIDGEEFQGIDEDECITKITILDKDDTQVKYCLSWEQDFTSIEEEEWVSFEDITFDCFLDPIEALTSYITKNKRMAKIYNEKQEKDYFTRNVEEAEAYLELLKEED